MFAPPSPVASPSSLASPSSSSSYPGITYSEKRVRLPIPRRVQLGQLQGQYNISALGSAAAFNLFVPPPIGKGVSDTTAACCLFEMSEAAFSYNPALLTAVRDTARLRFEEKDLTFKSFAKYKLTELLKRRVKAMESGEKRDREGNLLAFLQSDDLVVGSVEKLTVEVPDNHRGFHTL